MYSSAVDPIDIKVKAKRIPLPNPKPPFSMSNKEFEQIGRCQYQLRKNPKVSYMNYRHRARDHLKLQIALMYEILALKQPLDYEAEERENKIQALTLLIQDKKKLG